MHLAESQYLAQNILRTQKTKHKENKQPNYKTELETKQSSQKIKYKQPRNNKKLLTNCFFYLGNANLNYFEISSSSEWLRLKKKKSGKKSPKLTKSPTTKPKAQTTTKQNESRC